jgi:hypothetical protein
VGVLVEGDQLGARQHVLLLIQIRSRVVGVMPTVGLVGVALVAKGVGGGELCAFRSFIFAELKRVLTRLELVQKTVVDYLSESAVVSEYLIEADTGKGSLLL